MSTISTAMEERLLRTVERRYKRRGYDVILQPRGAALPPFLLGCTPDMFAFKGHESVVVEIKQRADLPTSTHLIDIADRVNEQQGWRFDLAVVKPRTATAAGEHAELLKPAEIAARLQATHALAQDRQHEAAILLAWSAAEAALRLTARQQHVTLEDERPTYMVKKLYTMGILSEEDYDILQRGLHFQNVIAHGFRSPAPDPDLAESLIRKVQDLLQLHASERAV